MQTENRSQKIAVTGATGRVGSRLVEILTRRGHDVVPIARSKGVDVVSGEGLDEALAGAETIIDTATGPSPDQEEATGFFTASAPADLIRTALSAASPIRRTGPVQIDRINPTPIPARPARLTREMGRDWDDALLPPFALGQQKALITGPFVHSGGGI